MASNTNLGNTPVSQGYTQLFHTGETGGLTSTLQQVFDGDGTGSDLYLATNKVKIGTAGSFLIGSKTIQEYIQDIVGDMLVTNGSHTNLTATYDDNGDGAIDLNAQGAVTGITAGTGITTSGSGNITINVNTSTIATRSYVDTEVAGLVDSAPGTLDTLNELASALGDDPNFATSTATSLGNRLRIDTASQGLTSTQKTNALTNLGITSTSAEINVLDGYTGSVTELNYLDTLHATGVTNTEFDYLDGVTSNIQTQLNNKQASDPVLDDISAIDTSVLGLNDTDKFIAFSGSSASFVLSSAPATQMSGSTNNGLLTYNSASVASVESGLTFASNFLNLNDSQLRINNTSASYDWEFQQDNGSDLLFKINGTGGAEVRINADGSNFNTTKVDIGGEIRLSANGTSYFKSASAPLTIGGSTAYTIGGTPRLSLQGAGLNIGANANDLIYIRRIDTGDFQLQTWNGNNDGQIHLQPYGGNVGIGVTNPSRKLQVAGAIELSTADTTLDTNNFALRRGASGEGFLDAPGNIQMNIDTNNNQSDAYFAVCHDAGSTPLFKVLESGAITFNNAYTFPTADGSNAQVLATNGSGNLFFTNALADPYGNLSEFANVSAGLSDDGKTIAFSQSSASWILGPVPITTSGTTQDGLLTYNSATTMAVESNLTFSGGVLSIDNDDVNEGGQINLLPGTGHTSTYTIDNFYGHLRFFSSATAGEQFRLTSTGNLAQLTGTKHYFNGDGGNTYIDEVASGQLRLVAGGTEAMKFYSSGAIDMYGGSTTSRSINIGANRSGNGYSWIDLVGDATYTNYGARFIRGNGGANTSSEIIHRGTGVLALKAYDAGSVRFYTSNAERVRIDSSGNIGVGNIAPNEKLQINSNTTYDTKIRLGDNGTGRYFLAGMFDSNTGMIGYVNGSPSHLAFHTGTGATGSEKMRITTDGNVGIGLNNPDSPLHIANNVATSAGFDSFADYQILLYDTGTSSTSYGLGIRGGTMMFNSDDDYEWRYDNSAVMFLDGSAGRLGINNTSPAYALDVSGGGRFTGHVDFDSTITIDSVLYGSTINTSGELNFTGNGNKIIDVETLANSNYLLIRHHNPVGNQFEQALKLTANGSAELFYNNSKKFETTNTGAKITGTTNSDLFSLEGAGSSFKLITESGDATSIDSMAYRLGLRYGSNDNGFIDFYRGPDGATGYLAFGASGSEAMRLDRYGKLGIGETSIDANLHISGSPVVLKMDRVGTRAMRMGVPDNSSDFVFADSDDLKSNQRLELTGGGDVYVVNDLGVGVASPSAKLEVNGTSNFTGEMYIDHGGSDYSPGISFMGGTNTPGSNTYENAQLAYYDSSGTGYFRSRIARWGGDFRWIIGDSGGDVTCAILSKAGLGIKTGTPASYTLDVNGNARFVADARCEGRYLSQNGSQSAPSYSFNSQGNAGMFRIGTGIGLSAGGSTIVQVNADGRVNYNSLTGVDHITIRSNGHTNSSSAGTFYIKFCTIVVDNSPSNYNGLSLSGTLYRGDNASGNTIDWSVWFNSGLDSQQITHGGYMMSKGAVFIDNIFVQRTAGDGEIDNGSCTYELYYDLSQSWTNNIYNIATEVHYPSEGKYNVTWNSDQSEVTTLPGTQVVNVQTATFDGTNQTKVPHGSASYPAYSFLGDMNTGIYRQASDTMSFSMGGTEKFRFESDGDFHTAQDVIAYSTTPSDRKLKDNIKDIEYGLDTIMQLSPKEYDWKKDNRHDIGFIAQEVEEVIPEIVKNKEWFDDKIKTLDYEKLTAVLIKAVQEQQDQINELREKLNG